MKNIGGEKDKNTNNQCITKKKWRFDDLNWRINIS